MNRFLSDSHLPLVMRLAFFWLIALSGALPVCLMARIALAAPVSGSLTTNYLGGNSNSGVAFDIVAGPSILRIERIAVNMYGGSLPRHVKVYKKEDGFSSGSSWVQIFDASVVSAGPGNPTELDIADFDIPENGTAALYVLITAPPTNEPGNEGRLHITDGSSPGAPWYSNSDLSILQGYGSTQAFASFYSTRNFQGTIYYTVNPTSNDLASNDLAAQQSSLSNLVVNSQSKNIADAAFDQVGNAFGQGTGLQITDNGFSASTNGVANWVGDKQRQRLETQLADLPRDADGNEIYVTPVAALFPKPRPKWNAWIKGNWTFYDGDGSSFDGYMFDVLAGFDYRVDNGVVMGLLGGYGNTDFDTEVSGIKGSFKADGYTVGPYVGVKLSENVQFDILAAYTYSDYDNKLGVTKGDFIAHRVTVAAQVKGTWHYDSYFFEPGVRIVYAEERQDAYTDSADVHHGSLKVRAGRVSIGPKIGYSHTTTDGDTIRPWVAVKGEYDFSNQGNVPTSGLPDLDDVLSARVSLGIDAAMKNGVGLSVQGDVSGLGGGAYTGYGGTARIDVPF